MANSTDLGQSEDSAFRNLFELNPCPMWVYDLDTLRFLAVNESAVQRYGYSREEFDSMKVTDIRPEAEVPRLLEGIVNPQPTLRGKGLWRHRYKNGDERDIDIWAHALMFGGHRAELVLAIDVTEKERTMRQLTESEERFRLLVQSAPEPIFIQKGGSFIFANDAMARLASAASVAELLGSPVLERFPGGAGDFSRSLRSAHGTPPSFSMVEEVFVDFDGNRVYVEVSSVPFFYGGAMGSLVFLHDITLQNQTKLKIEHLNGVLRTIRDVNKLILRAESSDALIAEGCRLLVAHKSYKAALLVQTGENKRLKSYVHCGMEARCPALLSVLDAGKLPACCDLIDRSEGVLMVSSKEQHCMKCSIDYVFGSEEVMGARLEHGGEHFGYLLVVESGGMGGDEEEQDLFSELAGDIAFALRTMGLRAENEEMEKKQKGLEQQLRQAQKLEGIGRLAGGVAHDFNNMLQTILGNVELALLESKVPGRARECLGEIEKAASHSADLTRQLLAFARQQTVAPEIVDLNTAVTGILKLLTRLIGENIQLDWRPSQKLWPVLVDPGQIYQILANLVVNSRDAMAGPGRIIIETSCVAVDESFCATRLDAHPGDYSVIAVSDEGCGMSKETLDRVFDPFFTTKEIGVGTGLGLATVYGIIKQNGGFIIVNSELGSGTTFRLYLPKHSKEADGAQKVGPGNRPSGGKETILFVEDEASLLALGKRLLERLGYNVIPTNSPSEAVLLAEQHGEKIDLLMTDVVMPGMSGRDLWEKLQPLHPQLRCMYMSGYTANVISRHGVLDEGINFLQKPFTIAELAEKIREALGGVRSLPTTNSYSSENRQ